MRGYTVRKRGVMLQSWLDLQERITHERLQLRFYRCAKRDVSSRHGTDTLSVFFHTFPFLAR